MRVVFDRVRCESRLWLNIGEFVHRWRRDRAGGALSLVPPSDVVHIAHHRGGPFHSVTIFVIGSLECAGSLAHGSAQGRRHTLLGLHCAVDIEGHDCELAGACPAFPAAAGRERQMTSLRLAREHALRRPACSCATNARISREPTSSLVAPHPDVRRPNPLTRVSVTLPRECQQPCHSGPAPVVPAGWRSSRNEPLTRENGVNGNEITLW